MTLVNRLDGFQSIIESAKAQVSGSANTQLVVELTEVGAFLKDMADLATALEMQENITQSNPEILGLTTLLSGNIARVLKPALEAQTVQAAPAAINGTPANPALQAQFDAGLQEIAKEDALTADIQRQIQEQQTQAQAQAVQAPQPQQVAYQQGQGWTPVAQPYPAPAGLPTQAEVQAHAQQAPAAPAPAPIGGQDLTANFRAQLAQAQPTAPVAPAAPVQGHPIAATEDPLTASIRAQVSGQAAPVAQPVQAQPVQPAAPTNPVQDALQQAFDAGLKEVRGQ